MKKYKLVLMENNSVVGQIDLSNNFNEVSIELEGGNKKKYQGAFGVLIKSIIQQGNFKVVVEDLNIKNSTQLFWTALVQELLLSVGILVVLEKKDQ